MTRMSGAEALVTTLKHEGVEVIFGIPGVQIMDAVDAVARDGSIRWISAGISMRVGGVHIMSVQHEKGCDEQE